MVWTTRRDRTSMRETVSSSRLATQTEPARYAMLTGAWPTLIGRPTMSLVRTLIRTTVSASWSATQTESGELVTADGLSPTGIVRVTRRRRGSIRVTVPASLLVAHTEPPPIFTE